MAFCTTFFGWAADTLDRLTGTLSQEILLSIINWTSTDPRASNPRAVVALTSGIHEPESAKDILARAENITLGTTVWSAAAALNNILFARSQEEPARGSFKVTDTVVKVRWAWLPLLLALKIVSLVLLVAAKVRRGQVAGLWKDSLLTVLDWIARMIYFIWGWGGQLLTSRQRRRWRG